MHELHLMTESGMAAIGIKLGHRRRLQHALCNPSSPPPQPCTSLPQAATMRPQAPAFVPQTFDCTWEARMRAALSAPLPLSPPGVWGSEGEWEDLQASLRIQTLATAPAPATEPAS